MYHPSSSPSPAHRAQDLATDPAAPLPPGWISEFSPQYGLPYYVDTAHPERGSTWQRPAWNADGEQGMGGRVGGRVDDGDGERGLFDKFGQQQHGQGQSYGQGQGQGQGQMQGYGQGQGFGQGQGYPTGYNPDSGYHPGYINPNAQVRPTFPLIVADQLSAPCGTDSSSHSSSSSSKARTGWRTPGSGSVARRSARWPCINTTVSCDVPEPWHVAFVLTCRTCLRAQD